MAKALSETHKILLVGCELLAARRSEDDLRACVGVSRATLLRYLAELRRMGCRIVNSHHSKPGETRVAGATLYELQNAEQVELRLLRWLDLESTRYLAGALGEGPPVDMAEIRDLGVLRKRYLSAA